MRFSTPAVLLFLFATTAQAQNIGINLTGLAPAASAMLDVDNANKGMLVPRVALTATNSVGPITGAMANSLLVYNTATAGVAPNNVVPGFYYYETGTSTWIPILAGVKGWSILGNSGTVAGTNFIGTTDAADFVVKTGGVAATNERMRVLAGGQTVINNTGLGLNTTDVFSVYGTGSTNGTTTAINALGPFSINGYATGNGTGLYGETSSATTSQGISILGILNAVNVPAANPTVNNLAILGINTSAPAGTATTSGNARSIEGDATGAAGLGVTMGVAGFATSTSGDARGVFGFSGSSFGVGVMGYANSATATLQPIGLYGSVLNATGFGALVENTNNSGTGEFAIGQNATGTFLTNGSGGVYCGKTIGGFGFAETVLNGCGLVGAGNNGSILTPSRGCGVVGTGKQYGVMGFATTTVNTNFNNNSAANGANASAGGYFEVQNAGTAQTWAYVAVREVSGAGGLRKIIGTGTVNTIVKDLKGNLVALSCPEAPESLFQDYGAGQLLDGKAHIELDPILAKNIVVDEKHPLRVFVQLEGDCNGVFVSNKTGTGFDVTELAGGTSAVAFTYTVAANRADEVLPDGSISRYSAERFPAAPGPMETVTQETKKALPRTFATVQPASDTQPVKGQRRP